MPPPPTPLPPLISADQILSSLPVVNPNYWPWPQQQKWSDRDVALQVKAAMEAAKSKDTAQATVLLDEVGPHLGNRSKLIYPIGALLQRIGRPQSVDKMLENASEIIPSDNNFSSRYKEIKALKTENYSSAEVMHKVAVGEVCLDGQLHLSESMIALFFAPQL